MRKIRLAAVLASSLAVLLAPARASAHAMLKSAAPAVGSTVQIAPTSVDLTFSSSVEPEFSTIVVQSADGVRVDKNDTHLVADDARRLSVTVGSVPVGRYTVIWHATSTDTHKTQGSFTFTVAR